MSYSPEEIKQFIEEEDTKFIRLAFRDAFGIQKNISVMPTELDKAFSEGIPVNASSIAGFEGSGYANLYLKPDAQTLAILPWRPERGSVIRMFCDVCTPDGEPFEADTRTILKRALKEAEKEGVSFKFGSESEFYLFKKDEEGFATGIPYDDAGYMDIAPLDRCENIRREICLTIERMGLRPERSHHERGPGQNEIDFHYGEPLTAADHLTTFKMAVSTIADMNGLYADFSPLPMPEKPGNGYHINIYAKRADGTDVCTYAAAGIIDRIRDITIFLNPSDSSYQRFGMCTAPDRVDWGRYESSELICITDYKDMVRTELRSPDALSNPYLVYALLIYAGLYGIRNKLTLPEKAGDNAALLPQSVREAGSIARQSEFVRGLLPREIIDIYCR